LPHGDEGGVERRTACIEWGLTDCVIFWPAAQRQPDGETAAGELIDGCDLLRQHDRVSSIADIQHGVEQFDPFGERRRRERHDWVQIVVDQSIDDAKRRESGMLARCCPRY
jgi:hypothetical protein